MSARDRLNSWWIRWCAYAAFISALPTAVWRVLPGLGLTMGTPEEWRAFQDLPGTGTWYVLTLSVLQLLAAACCLALAVDARRIVPDWAPRWVRQLAPYAVGIAGLLGAAALTVIISMSAIAWENVDPFAGEVYGGWAWLCLACYLVAILWPLSLATASIGYLMRHGHDERSGSGRDVVTARS